MIQAQEIEIKKLTPNKGQIEGVPTNPRKATKEQIEKLKKSIEETPTMLQLREIIAYDNNGELVIVGGNMRYQALKALGHKTALVKVLPADTPKETINAFIIKDNAQFGEWDIDLLANEWDKDKLDDWGVEIDWAVEAPEQPKEAEEDDFSEEEAQQAPAIVKKGEIWQLGEHRLMCGDSTDLEQVKMLMGGVLADMVFTDPPYGVSYTGGVQFDKNGNSEMHNRQMILNDNVDIYDDVLKVLSQVTDGPCYIWFADTKAASLYRAAEKYGELHSLIIWVKNGGYGALMANYKQKHEPCLYWKPKGAKLNFVGATTETTIWEINKDGVNNYHPTQKPVSLPAKAIGNHKAETVLDLFGGSGSTMMACEQMNRKNYTMELDPHYCDVIIARWEKLTGKKAERITHA